MNTSIIHKLSAEGESTGTYCISQNILHNVVLLKTALMYCVSTAWNEVLVSHNVVYATRNPSVGT